MNMIALKTYFPASITDNKKSNAKTIRYIKISIEHFPLEQYFRP